MMRNGKMPFATRKKQYRTGASYYDWLVYYVFLTRYNVPTQTVIVKGIEFRMYKN